MICSAELLNIRLVKGVFLPRNTTSSNLCITNLVSCLVKCHSPLGKMCEEGVPVFVPDVTVSPGLGDCHARKALARNDRKCHSPTGTMCEEGVPVFVPDVTVSPGLGDPTRGHCCHARKALARNDRNNRGLLDRPDPTQGGDRDEHDQHCQYSGQETTALTLVHHMQVREETFHFPVWRSEPGE
jgi:hypothetical protein